MARSFRAVGQALARAASDKKAEAVVLLDVRLQSPITEYMIIATVTSPPHLAAVEDEVGRKGKELRCPALRRARPESGQWRVLDFGGLMVHFMTEEARRFYALEKLFHRARPVAWDEAAVVPARPRKASRA